MLHKTTSLATTLASADAPTWATVGARIAADPSVPQRRKREYAWANRTFARALGRRQEEIPAHPAFLREQFKRLTPAMGGVSARSWANVRCLFGAQLKHVGLADIPGRYKEPMTVDWSEGLARLADPHDRFSLSRLGGFCSARGTARADVTDEVLDLFREKLEGASMCENPRKVHKNACRALNKAIANAEGWPSQTVTVPDYRTKYVLPWETFPPSLQQEVASFVRSRSDADEVSEAEARPLKPSTRATHERQLHEYASALVHRGIDPQRLGSMADLVNVENLKEGLRFIIGRSKSPKSKHASDIAGLIANIATHWVRCDGDQLRRIKAICRNIRPPKGMTENNSLKLRQFDDPANVSAFVNLPQRVVARRPGKTKPLTRALEIQSALAAEILLMLPLRIGNLVGLDLEKHIKRTRRGIVHIRIPKAEVKNEVAIEATLPAQSGRLLDAYIKDARPILYSGTSRVLFPSRSGGPKSISAFGSQISRFIRRECELEVHPHLFRHIGAKLYLDQHPGAYGLVRLLHGHKSVETTTTYYCGREAKAAQQRFDEHVLKLRDTTASPSPVPPKRKRPVPRKPKKGSSR